MRVVMLSRRDHHRHFDSIQEEVIEAGMEGALSEATVERALVLHDKLIKALDRERTMAGLLQAAQQGQGQGRGQGQGPGQGGSITDDLIDFGEDSRAASASPAAAPPQGPSSSSSMSSSSSAAAAVTAATATAVSAAGLPPSSDDAFAIFGPVATNSSGQQQQEEPRPPDSAVLAEADQLLQQLSLSHQEGEQQQHKGGEGKRVG